MQEAIVGVATWVFGNLAWQVLMSALVRGAVSTLFRKSLDWKQEIAFWLLVPVALFAATNVLRAKEPTPDLRATIDRVSIASGAQCSADGNSLAGAGQMVLVTASVRNLGAQSVAYDWALGVEAGGRELRGKKILIEDHFNFQYETEKWYRYEPRHALDHKTASTPLPFGGREQGFILFLIEEGSPAELTRPGTRYFVRFKDVTGKQYEVEHAWPSVATGFRPLPGLDVP